MTPPIHGGIPTRARRPRALPAALAWPALPALLVAWALVALVGWPGAARAQQLNFKPLERGEFTEVEERVMVARGLEVGADFALSLRSNHQQYLPPELEDTDLAHDLRLKLNTVFHRDVRLHVTLELSNQTFNDLQLHTAPADARGRLADAQPLALSLREVYLRYNFNPRSGLILGKQELSLGDRRGKVFTALVPGATFDCQAGTWCLPLGVARVGPYNSDAVTHFALQYNAWDIDEPQGRRKLAVEVFRIRYDEGNVPLGTNLGPATFDPADPDTNAGALPGQLLNGSAGAPVYFDAARQDYFGFRVDWQSGAWFVNFDYTGYRGERRYHEYDTFGSGPANFLDLSAEQVTTHTVSGNAIEAEIGWRFDANGHVGLRLMNASGDEYQDYAASTQDFAQDYNRGLSGYFEIVPGSYTGTRLWFNGANTRVELGSGLGHSINNTRLVGVFMNWADPDKRRLGYSGGLYQLSLNHPIPDSDNVMQDAIGLEWDNMLTWYVHKALRLQVELNGILAGGALRANDFSRPNADQRSIYQVIGRIVYAF